MFFFYIFFTCFNLWSYYNIETDELSDTTKYWNTNCWLINLSHFLDYFGNLLLVSLSQYPHRILLSPCNLLEINSKIQRNEFSQNPPLIISQNCANGITSQGKPTYIFQEKKSWRDEEPQKKNATKNKFAVYIPTSYFC